MPIKFGPEGYTGPTIRRYEDRRPPDIAERFPASAVPQRRVRVAGLLLAVIVIVGMVAYWGRLTNGAPALVATGSVVAKDSISMANAPTKRVLGLEIQTAPNSRQTVVLECDEETWARFSIGDAILAHYSAGPNGQIIVTSIEPKPVPVEL